MIWCKINYIDLTRNHKSGNKVISETNMDRNIAASLRKALYNYNVHMIVYNRLFMGCKVSFVL